MTEGRRGYIQERFFLGHGHEEEHVPKRASVHRNVARRV